MLGVILRGYMKNEDLRMRTNVNDVIERMNEEMTLSGALGKTVE